MKCEANGCAAALEPKNLAGSAMGGPSPWLVTDIPPGWCVRVVENTDVGSGRLVVMCPVHSAGVVRPELPQVGVSLVEQVYGRQPDMPPIDGIDLQFRMGAALDTAHLYGGIDGAHHKTWVIDQMVRALTGDRYQQWVAAQQAGADGPNTYEWEEGIAP